ncbi:MAG: PrsW family intramembrane metalloprotease [Bacteroidales bacterium]|nr:PrsW family intramembrane metalloprotease [Bacteroidales bacterium]
MPTILILIGLAILPVVVLTIYIYHKDKFGKEPFGMLVRAFFAGCLSIAPAIFLEKLLMDGAPENSVVLYSLYNGFVVAGFSEELSKLVLFFIFIWGSKHYNEYFDGVVYAAVLSLGFAGVENISYVLDAGDFSSSLYTALLRAAVSVPGHFLFGVAMGYYLSLAKFEKRNHSSNLFNALFVPLLLHGTFDALVFSHTLFSEDKPVISMALFGLFIYFDIKIWKAGKRRLTRMQMKSEVQYWENYQYNDDNGPESV